jgi:hypothetical protein
MQKKTLKKISGMVSGVQFNRGKEHWSEWFLKFPYKNI